MTKAEMNGQLVRPSSRDAADQFQDALAFKTLEVSGADVGQEVLIAGSEPGFRLLMRDSERNGTWSIGETVAIPMPAPRSITRTVRALRRGDAAIFVTYDGYTATAYTVDLADQDPIHEESYNLHDDRDDLSFP